MAQQVRVWGTALEGPFGTSTHIRQLTIAYIQLPGVQCPIQDFTGIAHMHICTLRYTIKIKINEDKSFKMV